MYLRICRQYTSRRRNRSLSGMSLRNRQMPRTPRRHNQGNPYTGLKSTFAPSDMSRCSNHRRSRSCPCRIHRSRKGWWLHRRFHSRFDMGDSLLRIVLPGMFVLLDMRHPSSRRRYRSCPNRIDQSRMGWWLRMRFRSRIYTKDRSAHTGLMNNFHRLDRR